MQIIIPETQAAVNVALKHKSLHSEKSNLPYAPTLWAWGIGSGESVKLQAPKVANPDVDTDGDWFDLQEDSSDVALTEGDNFLSIYAITSLRLVKSSTTAACGVAISGGQYQVVEAT